MRKPLLSEKRKVVLKNMKSNQGIKIRDVLEKVHLSGDIPLSIKCRWLGELDKKVYRYPDDADTELKYSFDLYKLYLIAMNDFYTGELEAYSASAILFEQAYEKERGARLCR